MMVPCQDIKSALKLVKLYKAFEDGSHIKIIQKILEQEGDINFAIPVDSPVKVSRPHWIGRTALHFACTRCQIDLFTNLLDRDADFTKKCGNGKTVLHMLIGNPEYVTSPSVSPFINAVLSAHVKSNNSTNPCDGDGLSHFHVACITSHLKAVQFFLNHGVSVDQPININSKFLPGYSPLHLAAMCTDTELVEALLAHGANVNTTDAKGRTPLHLLIVCRMQMFDAMGNATCERDSHTKFQVQKQIGENEKIINMLLENTSSDNDSADRIGLTNFHVACTMQDTVAARHLVDRVMDIDQCVNMDSQLWPGYTALHFAAHVSIDTVELLMNEGANAAARDAKRLTPLDLCIERYKIDDICWLMSLDAKYANVLFSDGKTKLLSFIDTLHNPNTFKQFIRDPRTNVNMIIPQDSPLWPGYTLLHLAVLFSERSRQTSHKEQRAQNALDLQILKLCLEAGADLRIQDTRGQSALHLAFHLNKLRVVEVILLYCYRHIPNVSDDENLTHLHIVCAVSKSACTLKKFTLTRADANAVYRGTSPVNGIRPGSTPLHAFLDSSTCDFEIRAAISILMRFGADPCIEDAYGLTPIHWLLRRRYPHPYLELLERTSEDRVAEEYGISHLHVACRLGDVDAVKRLLENGADVNLAIGYRQRDAEDTLSFLSSYDKHTPLHLARNSSHVQELLLERGADVFGGSTSHLRNDPTLMYYYMAKVWNDDELQRRMEREFGWTRLHLACYLLQVDGFEDTVKAESANINARVFSNSPIWRGFTPLRLLLMYRGKSEDMTRILLGNGADVTVNDDERNSPVGVLFKSPAYYDCALVRASLLMKYHRDYSVNPVNSQGVSHFHIACYVNDLNAVRGFLEHGVDVNRPIDYFADWHPGSTPLHLASKIQVVELLVDRGADIHAEDVRGCSVLAEALKPHTFDETVVTKMIESGANVNGQNFKGETPFEIAILNGEMTMKKLIFCIRQGFHVNSCNSITGVGYLAMVLGTYYRDINLQKLIVETIVNKKSTTILGRTTLHHLVTGSKSDISIDDYALLIGKLVKSGQDIDQRDNDGRTPLHLAVKFQNTKAVHALLRLGVDVNVVDVNGNSALSTRFTQVNTTIETIKQLLIVRACQLVLLKLKVSEGNKSAALNAPTFIHYKACNDDFKKQIALSKKIRLGVGSIRLYDFLMEFGAVTKYPLLTQADRITIDRYFESMNENSSLEEIRGLLNLQYRKAVRADNGWDDSSARNFLETFT